LLIKIKIKNKLLVGVKIRKKTKKSVSFFQKKCIFFFKKRIFFLQNLILFLEKVYLFPKKNQKKRIFSKKSVSFSKISEKLDSTKVVESNFYFLKSDSFFWQNKLKPFCKRILIYLKF